MYFPYLRGKQFELEALLEVNSAVYQNTLPILEPITLARRRLYTSLTNQNVPLILVTNPFYPVKDTISSLTIQNVLDNELANHKGIILAFIIDQRFVIQDLDAFLSSNPTREKAIIFRYNLVPAILIAIQALLINHSVRYIIFDESKTSSRTQTFFNSHPRCVLLTDGFQRQERNADYPVNSGFDSIISTWRTSGWQGIGDYLTVGDYFRSGGGQPYVVTLHLTVSTTSGLVMQHFSSTSHPTTGGFAALKFTEANRLLNTSSSVLSLASSGLTLFRTWHTSQHFPQLGAAKKASMMHHIEFMSSLI
jgi:hypothetical protein